MSKTHWYCCVLMLIAGYFLGVYYPSIGKSTVSKASSLV